MLAAVPAAALLPAGDALSASGSGGAFASDPARIERVSCVAQCPTLSTVRPGSTVRLEGSGMGAVHDVVFLGGRGPRDDATATATVSQPDGVEAVVPAGARSGRVRVVNGDGARSRAAAKRLVLRELTSRRPLQVRTRRRAFAGSAQGARLELLAQRPLALTVTVVRSADGAPVADVPVGELTPGTVRIVSWDGLSQPGGRYEFRVAAAQAATTGGAEQSSGLPPQIVRPFDLVDHRFPVQGRHDFGGFGASFGGGRGHQGQDVLSSCGTPVVAARGGVVRHRSFHGRAGNYLVIAGAGTGLDYAYMHLREPALVEPGAVVATGQQLGHVGRTGRASACHLHFELWSAPGWRAGGQPIDPRPMLEAWAATS